MADLPATDDISTPLLFGRYRILQQVGEGRLTTIYHATDERLQRPVLLHLLRKDLVEHEQSQQRFIAEINASAQRSHSALLEVFDSGSANSRPYMVTEYVEGRSLHALGSVTLEQAILYMRQLAGAITACETRGVPYPPISSNNVLVIDDGRVKLVENWTMPSVEVPLDLAHYRAPERTEGKPQSPASVVYTLGLLLYELITGKRPIRGNDPWAVSQAHLTTRIPPLAHVCPALYLPSLERLIGHAIARDPGQRLPNIAAFSEALDAFWRDLSAETQQLPILPTQPQKQRGQADMQATLPAPAFIPAPMPDSASLLPSSVAPNPPSRAKDQSLWPLDRAMLRRQMLQRGIVGWGAILLLLIMVVFGSYMGASYLVDRLFAIEIPRPTMPDIGLDLPDWVPGVGEREIFVVNAPALNVRDQPGLAGNVIDAIPNSTRVRKLEGPDIIAGDPWLRIQADLDGRPIEGWVSASFLVPLE